jgi:hypothetical protein
MENAVLLTEKCLKLEAKVAELEHLVKWYESQLLSLKRRQFGTSSERVELGSGQLSLFGVPEAAPPPKVETEVAAHKRKQKGKREEDIKGLPVERIDYELSETGRVCPECGRRS